MYHNSLFSDLIKVIDREKFSKMVCAHRSDRYGKSFKSWQHLIAMLFCQFSGACSLREAELIYMNQRQSHYHLHLKSLKRSTLSQSNNTRNPALFKGLATLLMERCHSLNKELGSVVQLIDSSPIMIKGRGNQWTKDNRTRNIQGLKLHLMIEPDHKTLDYLNITHANVNDITDVAGMSLQAHKIYVFDKGYCDYNWWKAIVDKKSVFVTRLKANACYSVLQDHDISEDNKGFILSDQTITLVNKAPRGGKINHLAGIHLRLIKVARLDNKPLIIICNDLIQAPNIIAGHYKARWGIELFFKWIKRYLKVKTFLGESENSIKIQLYTAIIAYLLMWFWRKLTLNTDTTLSQVKVFIQAKLFDKIKTDDLIKMKKASNHNNQLNLAL